MTTNLSHASIIELSNKAWLDIINGAPASGIDTLNIVLKHSISVGELCNRGIAYLMLERYSEATNDFVQARNLPPANRSIAFVGASLWLDGKKEEACQDWVLEINERRMRKLFYTDAAGGLVVPALLWWAGICLQSHDYQRIAEQEMNRRLRTVQAQTNWPGAVAMFLTKKITAEELLEQAEHKYANIQANQLCQANFHIASYYNSLGDSLTMQHFLRKCINEQSVSLCEFHLATGLLRADEYKTI